MVATPEPTMYILCLWAQMAFLLYAERLSGSKEPVSRNVYSLASS